MPSYGPSWVPTSAYPTDSHSTAPTVIPNIVPAYLATAEPTQYPTDTPGSMSSYGPTKPKNVCKKKKLKMIVKPLGVTGK